LSIGFFKKMGRPNKLCPGITDNKGLSIEWMINEGLSIFEVSVNQSTLKTSVDDAGLSRYTDGQNPVCPFAL
jgi:hypothetical protein